MTPRTLLAAAACLALALPGAGEQLLPPGFAGWSATAAKPVPLQDLEQLLRDKAPLLREFIVVRVETGTYARGSQNVAVTVYQMRDPTAAYGAFTLLQGEEMIPGALGEFSGLSSGRAVALAGNLVLEIIGKELPGSAADWKALVAMLGARAQAGPLPTVGQFLPAEHLVPGSRRYLGGPRALNRFLPLGNGDWIGFADGAEVELARYRLQGENVTVALAVYPTPQIAARKMEELGHWLALNQPTGSAGDGGRPAVHARRAASVLAIVAGARTTETAEALLTGLRYDSHITWNEPGFSASDPGVSEMVLNAIYGTGALLLFAVFAGLGFGGVRLAIKHFLPGKVFDRSPDVEIIQLGIGSKPIEAKDFYGSSTSGGSPRAEGRVQTRGESSSN